MFDPLVCIHQQNVKMVWTAETYDAALLHLNGNKTNASLGQSPFNFILRDFID